MLIKNAMRTYYVLLPLEGKLHEGLYISVLKHLTVPVTQPPFVHLINLEFPRWETLRYNK